MQNKASKKWVKPRHKVVTAILSFVLRPIVRFKYGAKIKRFDNSGKQYLVLYNHQTGYDQFFIGYLFKGAIYHIASEDVFSKGIISKIIRWAVAPIPIKKQVTDVRAVMNAIRVKNEGGTIALAPEGNRTYSGATGHINSAIAPLVKKLALPVAFVKIEGGYGVQPRWSNVIRRGEMKVYVSKVLEPSEYLSYSNDELLSVINRELYVDESKISGSYVHKKSAEYLERAVYVCDGCGLSTFESKGSVIRCKKCGKQITYGANKQLIGDTPFTSVLDWYNYQNAYINGLDITKFYTVPAYVETVDLYNVTLYKSKKRILKGVSLSLYGNKLTVGEREFLFDNSSCITVLGKNKLNVYYGSELYQVKGGKRFNAVKYVNFYNRYKNVQKGEENGEFLGL